MKQKTKWLPFFCQCHDCLETFPIDALVNNGRITRLEEHQRVGRNRNNDYYHRCGGNGHIQGRLGLYPVLKYWKS